MSDKNFDVVVYGATGFTGKLVVEYMLNQYGSDKSISWAMAGRSHEKLIAVRDASVSYTHLTLPTILLV